MIRVIDLEHNVFEEKLRQTLRASQAVPQENPRSS